MFRAFSIALAVVLCTSGWSKAHAAPKPIEVETVAKAVPWSDTLHRTADVVRDALIFVPPGAWLCHRWSWCQNTFFASSGTKDGDRERADPMH